MIFFTVIFGLIAVVAFVVALVARPGKYDKGSMDYRDTSNVRAWGLGVGVVMTIIMFVGFAFSAFFTVDEGEVGVEVLFGRIQTVHTAGIGYKNPFAVIFTYPTRTVESTYTDTEDEGDKAGFDAIDAFSAENAAVFVDLTVLWHVDGTQADHVYRTVKDQYREVLVRPITRSATRDCVALFDFDVARTTARGEVSQCILELMENQLAPRGIVIESIQLRGMRADAALQASIEAKLQAANAVKEAEFDKARADVDKLRAVVEAEARAESAVVEAGGEAERITLIAIAEAEANSLVALSLTDALLQLRIFEALSDSDNNLVIITDGDGITPLLSLPGSGSN